MDDDLIRAALKAISDRQDAQDALMDILRQQMAPILDLFARKDGNGMNNTEAIGRLDHRFNMMGGEVMALWRELEKLDGTLATINHLVVPNRRHVANGWQRPAEDGVSPYEVDLEE
jgi:hypothetical protein